ncbi:MAG: RNA polymerase sigma factor [Acidimicrobiales bacterium]
MIDRDRSPDRGVLAGTPTGSPSFESFYREHYRSVVRLATSVLGDAHAAQDVAQEVFLAAHDRFRGDVERAPGWVRVAAVHSALNVVRGERRRERRHRLATPATPVAGPEDVVVERETRREVRDALSRLSPRAATLLILRHGGLSYAEIAEALGVNVGQVGTRLRRAEIALAKEMTRGSRK